MVIVSYDISDDKLRIKFSKFLEQYGGRIQYSIFEIQNSERILNNIITEIHGRFSKKFTQKDSVIIFKLSETCKIERFGYAKNDESDLIIL